MTSFYYKTDGRDGWTGILAVTSIQATFALDLFALFKRLYFGKMALAVSKEPFLWVGFILLGILTYFNWINYKNLYISLKDRWNNETSSRRRINGFAIVLALIIPWIILIVIIDC